MLRTRKLRLTFLSCLLIVLAVNLVPVASSAPQSYLEETISADCLPNGSIRNIDRRGTVSVLVNPQDVLQETRIDLSDTTNTNLESIRALRASVGCPQENPTRLFLNTSEGDFVTSYKLNESLNLPLIAINLTYRNVDGGLDIHEGKNTIRFRLELDANKDLDGSRLIFQAAKDTYQGNDAIHFYNSSASSGLTDNRDTDSDGFNDQLRWSGNLEENNNVIVTFYGNITPNVNFDENLMATDLSGSATALYQKQGETFTGIRFSQRFSKSSDRQGIEMMPEPRTWLIRGFMKNIANRITYLVDGWELYRVGDKAPVESVNYSDDDQELPPGEYARTSWYSTNTTKKIYFATEFNWQIRWGSSNYLKQSRCTMDLPSYLEIASWADKTVSILNNTKQGAKLAVEDLVDYLGHTQLGAEKAWLNSTVPLTSLEGVGSDWTVSNLSLYYTNGTYLQDITNESQFQVVTEGGDKQVRAYTNASIIGKKLNVNERLKLNYTLTTDPHWSERTFVLGLRTGLWSPSGTPDYEYLEESVAIAPTISPPEPPEGGGAPSGGAGPAPNQAYLKKDRSNAYLVTESSGEVEVVYKAIDTGHKGIRNARPMIYIPGDGSLVENTVNLTIYDDSEGVWRTLEWGKDFEVVDRGSTLVNERRYQEYLLQYQGSKDIYGDAIALYDQDKLKIQYQADFDYGINRVLTRLFGYNYYQDKIISEDVYIPLRVMIKLSDANLTQSSWRQHTPLVGDYVKWTKNITAVNPNQAPMRQRIEIPVFKDAVAAVLKRRSCADKNLSINLDASVSWRANFRMRETKQYQLEVYTPPVVESRKEINVLEANSSWLKLKLDTEVKNTALENYSDVRYPFPLDRSNILAVNGSQAVLDKSGNRSQILLGDFNSLQSKPLSLVYRDQPPILITKLDRSNYSQQDKVNLTVFVVPSGKEGKGYVEVEAFGPAETSTQLKKTKQKIQVRYADILRGGISPGEYAKFSREIDLSGFSPGRYVIHTSFRGMITPLLSEKDVFYVRGKEIPTLRITIWFLLLTVALVVISYVLRKHRREEAFKRDIKEIKDKLEG